MTISLLAAIAKNGAISERGKRPWYSPAEMAQFKRLTLGHPIIMGRKTHDSIGRTLPGRPNIVVSKNPSYQAHEGAILVHSLEQALEAAKGASEIFVIGGQEIFDQIMPKTNKIYLTKVGIDVKGDKFFNYNPSEWEVALSEKHQKDEKNLYDFEFLELRRKDSNTQTQ